MITTTGKQNVDYKKWQEQSDIVIDKLLKEVESIVELTKRDLEQKEPVNTLLESDDNLVDNGDGTYSRKNSLHDSQEDSKIGSQSDNKNDKLPSSSNLPTNDKASSSSSSNNKNNLPQSSNQKYPQPGKKASNSDPSTMPLDNSADISSQVSKIESELDQDIQEDDDTIPADDSEEIEDEGNNLLSLCALILMDFPS